MVALVLIQQMLTVRYILLRPELSHLEKNPMQKKYHLCGRAYSTMNPRTWVRGPARHDPMAPASRLTTLAARAVLGCLPKRGATSVRRCCPLLPPAAAPDA